jgi:hypothetical protein
MVRMVTAQRLNELLDAYGADPTRWPEAERAAAQALLARTPDLGARGDAERLDAALARLHGEVPPAVVARVAAGIEREVASRSQSDATGPSWGALLWSATASTWPRAAAFAGVIVLGIVAGLSSDPSALSTTDGAFDGISGTSVMGEYALWSE